MRTAVKILTVILFEGISQFANAKTITVNSTADDGPGSLRQAIAAASNGDKINIVVNGTITLTSGELLVDKSLTIKGSGAYGVISGNSASRVLHITPGTAVTLDSLTITNGVTSRILSDFPNSVGAGIYADHAKLTITNCAISHNSAGAGGAVFSNVEGNSNSSLAIRNTIITGNSASFGGGVYNDAEGGNSTATLTNVSFKSNSADFGGGLFNDAQLNGNAIIALENCDFDSNSAVAHGGGIENNGEGGQATLSLKHCRISANSAAAVVFPPISFFVGGGGIFNDGFAGNATVSLEETSVTKNQISNNFNAKGAGILNHGFQGNASCVLKNCQVNGNGPPTPSFADAGITNYAPGGVATLALTNCAVSRNSGRGISNAGFDFFLPNVPYGAANVTLADTIISKNSNGGIANHSARLNATHTMIVNNSAFGSAGIEDEDSDATLTDCIIDGNSAVGDVGGIANASFNRAANLTVNNCRISNNTAGTFCGGILNESSDDPGTTPGPATLTINDTTISGNAANPQINSGGGILNGAGFAAAKATLNNCTVSGNSSTLGGGISNGSAEGSGTLATVTLNNTTLSGNSATASGGAIWVAGFGSDPIVVLNNCTLSGNNAPGGFGIQGAGIGVEGDPTAGFDAHPVIVMANTILNRGTSGENLVVVNTGAVVSHGYNLSSDGAGGDNGAEPGGFLSGTGDIRNRNPLLGPLQNNGGPTMTHALLQNSPAINAGDPNFNPYSFNPPLFYDQRGPGFPRVVNGRLDIGAFESALR